jgi:hypothetical protein
MIKHIFRLVKRRIKRRVLVAIFRKPKVIRASTREQAQHYIDNYGWPTTRCFARTTQEAFKDGEYIEWFFPPEKNVRGIVFVVTGVILWVGLCVYFWRSA